MIMIMVMIMIMIMLIIMTIIMIMIMIMIMHYDTITFVNFNNFYFVSFTVIPKELAKQCRNGCPIQIEQFCLTWKMLQNSMGI